MYKYILFFRKDSQSFSLREGLLLLQEVSVSPTDSPAQEAPRRQSGASEPGHQVKVRGDWKGHARLGHPQERHPGGPEGRLPS